MTPHPHPASAAAVLSSSRSTLFAALGVLCILAWYIVHRHGTHRHGAYDITAKILLIVGGVILTISIGAVAAWIIKFNDTTAGWLSAWSKDPTFTDKHLGVLTIAAVIDVAFVAFTSYDLIQKVFENRKKSATAASGGTGTPRAARSGARWGSAEVVANKYGWFSLGPLAVTIPAPAGVWIVTGLTLLSRFVGHLVGLPFGLG